MGSVYPRCYGHGRHLKKIKLNNLENCHLLYHFLNEIIQILDLHPSSVCESHLLLREGYRMLPGEYALSEGPCMECYVCAYKFFPSCDWQNLIIIIREGLK